LATPKGQHGRTAPAVANILPELVFDLADDQRQPRSLGKPETPMNVLPELSRQLMPRSRCRETKGRETNSTH
jgi:hypothetical protein